MAFHLIDTPYGPLWNKRGRRVLLVGKPNSGKTASLTTFLETPQDKMAYVCLPGEYGNSSLDLSPQVVPWVWDEEDITKKVAWSDIWKQLEELTVAILTGKHGKFDTIAWDGIHKVHQIALNKVTGGVSANSLDFDAKLYEDARKLTMKWLDMVFRSSVKNIVCTIWDGREKDDPDAQKAKDITTHIFPDLPGQFAHKILGEFGCVLYATIQGTGEATKYLWQTRPQGKVWGCGIKAPKAIARTIPTLIPQDWKKLYPLLFPNQAQFDKLAQEAVKAEQPQTEEVAL